MTRSGFSTCSGQHRQGTTQACFSAIAVRLRLAAADRRRREPVDICSAGADRLYADLTAKGVTIARRIVDQPYGCRDFEIDDCNGYRLCFGQDLEG